MARPAPARRKKPPQRPKAIVNLRDVEHPNEMNWLVYGQSGVGKTVLAGTMPKKSLLITTEPAGSASAKARGSAVDDLMVPTWGEFLSVTEWMEYEGHKEYRWVCLDGLTELEEHAWNAIMAQGNGAARSVGGSFRAKSRNDYPLVWDAIKRAVDRWNRMPVNVLFTAQTMRVDAEDEDGEDTTLLLPLVGSTKRGDTAMRICGQMTLVGLYRKHRSEEGKVARRLHTTDSERWVAKDRHDTFGRWVTNPNIEEMEKAALERVSSGATERPRKKKKG